MKTGNWLQSMEQASLYFDDLLNYMTTTLQESIAESRALHEAMREARTKRLEKRYPGYKEKLQHHRQHLNK